MVVLCISCKQKTSYEMRISDCSSDVCAADLTAWPVGHRGKQTGSKCDHSGQLRGQGQTGRLHLIRYHQHISFSSAMVDEKCCLRSHQGLHSHRTRRKPTLLAGYQPQSAVQNGARTHEEIGKASCRERVRPDG